MERDHAVGLLRQRLCELDTGRLPVVPSVSDPRLVHVVTVLQTATNTSMTPAGGRPAVLAPAAADALTRDSRLVAALAADHPPLVAGPWDRARQHWVGTARHHDPDRARFDPARAATSGPKPFGLGLHTSTATRQGPSMWRTYLDLYHGSDLYPLPWSTWELRPDDGDVSVLHITGAGDWAAFVDRYAPTAGPAMSPDWAAVSRDVDAVHVTLPAIVAAQGFGLRTARGITAPAFWDVESTLWLRWRFASARLLETTR